MRAMILAAGLGTRLRPLTDTLPKALVEIDGRTLLEITLARLRAIGIREVIVNAHHFADAIGDYLRSHAYFDMHIEVSREDVLLDTGGGLKQAAHFFASDPGPFVLHNVDVLTTIDLRRMIEVHCKRNALATLAVQQRDTSRSLLFDRQLRLCGRQTRGSEPEIVRPEPHLQSLAFCGIHVVSPRIFPLMTEVGVFSIIPVYLRLAAQGEPVSGFRADEYYWRDLGTPQSLRQAAADIASGAVSLDR